MAEQPNTSTPNVFEAQTENVKEIDNKALEELKRLLQANENLKQEDLLTNNDVNATRKELFDTLGSVLVKLSTLSSEERAKVLPVLQKVLQDPEIKSEIKEMYKNMNNKAISNLLKSAVDNPEMVLATMTTPREEEGELWYDVKFPTDNAEDRIGLGNILPYSEKFVMVETADGKAMVGHRNNSLMFKGELRPGFVDVETGQYIPIVNGDSFRVLTEEEYKARSKNGEYALKPTDGHLQFTVSAEERASLKEANGGKDVSADISFDEVAKLANRKYAEDLETVEEVEDFLGGVGDRGEGSPTKSIEGVKAFRDIFNALDIQSRRSGEPYNIEERIQLQNEIAKKITNLTGQEYEELLGKIGGDYLTARKSLIKFFKAARMHETNRFGSGSEVNTAITSFLNTNADKYATLINTFGGEKEFSNILLGLSAHESAHTFNPFIFSPSNCSGIFQFSGGTAKLFHMNPFSIEDSVRATVELMESNRKEVGNYQSNSEDYKQAIILSHNHGSTKVNGAGDLNAIIGSNGNPNGRGFYNKVFGEAQKAERYKNMQPVQLTPEQIAGTKEVDVPKFSGDVELLRARSDIPGGEEDRINGLATPVKQMMIALANEFQTARFISASRPHDYNTNKVYHGRETNSDHQYGLAFDAVDANFSQMKAFIDKNFSPHVYTLIHDGHLHVSLRPNGIKIKDRAIQYENSDDLNRRSTGEGNQGHIDAYLIRKGLMLNFDK